MTLLWDLNVQGPESPSTSLSQLQKGGSITLRNITPAKAGISINWTTLTHLALVQVTGFDFAP